jgi:hypothetical protein
MDRDQRPVLLTRLDLLGITLGAILGLVAAGPLVWLSAEAHRTGNVELSRAASLFPRQLLLVWLSSALCGGLLAAALSRLSGRGPRGLAGHLLRLAGGIAMIVLLSPLPAALIAMVVLRSAAAFTAYYVVSGGLIGWQSGVVSFVFLYTFRAVEGRRNEGGAAL